MKKYLLLLVLFLQSSPLIIGQSAFVSFGTIFSKSKAEAPIINAKEDFSNSSYPVQLGVEYFLSKRKIIICTNFFRYSGFTNILFNQPYIPNFPHFIAGGYGFKGTIIKRLDFELKYPITNINSPLFIKAGLGVGLQNSKSNGIELLYVPILGPDYIEAAPMKGEAYKTTQLIPIGSIDLGYRFFKKIELSLYAQGAIGHKPYQRQTFKYTYKGLPQPDAIYIADGTSVYVALKLGYRFHNLVRK